MPEFLEVVRCFQDKTCNVEEAYSGASLHKTTLQMRGLSHVFVLNHICQLHAVYCSQRWHSFWSILRTTAGEMEQTHGQFGRQEYIRASMSQRRHPSGYWLIQDRVLLLIKHSKTCSAPKRSFQPWKDSSRLLVSWYFPCTLVTGGHIWLSMRRKNCEWWVEYKL